MAYSAINSQQKEIIQLQREIFTNLGFNKEIDDISDLQTENPYFEMFGKMFPQFDEEIMQIKMSGQNSELQIQSFITLLDQQVLKMDLSHIKAKYVVSGNHTHLVNLLQILLLVSRQYASQNEQLLKQERKNNQVQKSGKKKKKKIQFSDQENDRDQDIPIDEFQQLVIESIKKTKEKLRNMRKENAPDIDMDCYNKIKSQKMEYKRVLKEFLLFKNSQNQQDEKIRKLQENNQKKREKFMKVEYESLQKEEEMREASQLLKQRDDDYVRLQKMKNLIFELEKEKILEDNRDLEEKRKHSNYQTINAFCSIENQYKNRIDMLKEKLKEKKTEKNIIMRDQIKASQNVQNELRQQKRNQIQNLKDLWLLERERQSNITQEEMQHKIRQTYKKY